ncbi:hypothetical protein [Calothrix sp. CCY 0018]
MKTVVIGGVCRTGKSRLANKVFNNTKATVFHGDHAHPTRFLMIFKTRS